MSFMWHAKIENRSSSDLDFSSLFIILGNKCHSPYQVEEREINQNNCY